MKLHVLVESLVSMGIIHDLEGFLSKNYPFIEHVILDRDVNIPKECWINSRHQYNAECLLDHAVKKVSNELVLMIVSEDIYIRDLNYVFGIGMSKVGSVISIFRLENNIMNLHKVILHEVGHVFGLLHCQIACSMTSSNSIFDIYQIKPYYCQACKKKLEKDYSP